jgi:hypothetical protein
MMPDRTPPPRPPRTPAPPLDAERLFTLEDVRRMSGCRPTPETDEDWARFIAELDARSELSRLGSRLPPAPGSLPKLPQSAFNLEKKKDKDR